MEFYSHKVTKVPQADLDDIRKWHGTYNAVLASRMEMLLHHCTVLQRQLLYGMPDYNVTPETIRPHLEELTRTLDESSCPLPSRGASTSCSAT